MERLVVIDHAAHHLYVEDVSDEELERYGGSEEAYIEDNYTFEGDYSWDYIVSAEYLSLDVKPDPIEINFEEIGDIF